MTATAKSHRELFEAAVVDRVKESGFLEIEIRTECLIRAEDGYQDEVINAGWHYWNAALLSAEEIREQKLAAVAAPDNGTATAVLSAVLECAEAWVPEARIIGNVRAGDIARVVRSILTFQVQDCDERAAIELGASVLSKIADPAARETAIRNALTTALYRSAPAHDVAATVEAFDREHPEIYWHIAKGKITAGEPLYSAIITDLSGNELGDGESNISAIDAFSIAVEDAGLPALSAQVQDVEGWRSLDSAPKKGEYLVYQPERKVGRTTLPARVVLNSSAGYSRPTSHWMPLPAFPTPDKGDAE